MRKFDISNKDVMDWTAVIHTQEEWNNVAVVVSGLKIVDNGCNEMSFTELDFSSFSYVKQIEIGANSLQNVNRVVFNGLNNLINLNISHSSLSSTSLLEIKSNSLNHPELKSLDLKAFSQLSKLEIGSNALTRMENITISRMPVLKSLSISPLSLNRVIK